jgi:hypothetical protein
MHWHNPPDDISQYAGFVYLIVNTISGQKYIGKKSFFTRRRKKVTGRKNRKVVVAESNWKTYTSSCAELNQDIKKYGKGAFRFAILRCCKTKRDMGYYEAYEQFTRDVLNKKLPCGEFEYYNKNILGKFYRTYST